MEAHVFMQMQDLQVAVAARSPRLSKEVRQRRKSGVIPPYTCNFAEARKTQFAAGNLRQRAVSHEAMKDAAFADVDLPFVKHPCPRVRHHPGEHCRCGMRLDVRIPHGYSRAADLGSLHAARLQNLRWRVSALGWLHDQNKPVPPWVETLAQDLQGAVATRVPRPLEEARQRRRSVIIPPRIRNLAEAWKSKFGAGNLGQRAAAHEATDEAPDEGRPRTPETPPPCYCQVMSHSPAQVVAMAQQRRPRSVNFVDSVEAEVPMILPTHLIGARHVPKGRQRMVAMLGTLRSRELQAQANMARIREHRRQLGQAVASVVQAMSSCFVGFHILRVPS
mmetsp:Transcript_51159/g.101618  ORF Transcript_51159/g.101618 Transcript_51159/m.101618 type:complete len:334 (-) Transcript_51159:244-1245(-)